MPKPFLPFSHRTLPEWIVQLEQQEDPDQRLVALQAVGALANPSEKANLAHASLHDCDPTIRAFAAKLTGSVQSPMSQETENRLVSLLCDPDPDVRFESARALIRRKSPQKKLILAALLPFLDERETQALMVAAVINALVEIELDPDTANADLQPRLLNWIDHERAEVREAVSTAFATWPLMSLSCTIRLLPLLDDSEPVVREKIAETLGKSGADSEQIRAALKAASEDEDLEVARAAVEALRRLN